MSRAWLSRLSIKGLIKHEKRNLVLKKKGNVDTDIVFTIMEKIAENEDFDKVILVSGDGDYIKMVKYLIEKCKLLRVLAPAQKSTSSLYKSIPSHYVDFLDSTGIKNKISRRK